MRLVAAISVLVVLVACVLIVSRVASRQAVTIPLSGTSPSVQHGLPAGRPRLAVFSPGIAATLRAAGCADLIAGRHGYDSSSDPSIPVVGDQAGIDYESLLKVRPTHVLIERAATPPPERLGLLALSNGWKVETIPLLALDDIRAMTLTLRGIAPADRAPAFAALEKEMDRAWARRTTNLSRAGRVLLLAATSPKVNALGPGSWHHQILDRIGGAPTMESGGPWIIMDAEDVIRLAPDAIVLFDPREPGEPSRTGPVPEADRVAALGILSRLDIPAVKHGRIGLIDDPQCLLPGAGMIKVADDLAALLEQWATPESAPADSSKIAAPMISPAQR